MEYYFLKTSVSWYSFKGDERWKLRANGHAKSISSRAICVMITAVWRYLSTLGKVNLWQGGGSLWQSILSLPSKHWDVGLNRTAYQIHTCCRLQKREEVAVPEFLVNINMESSFQFLRIFLCSLCPGKEVLLPSQPCCDVNCSSWNIMTILTLHSLSTSTSK